VIEHELYNYDETKREIEQLKNELIETPPTPMHERMDIQNSEISDPTHSKAYKILSNTFITHMERTVRAIDRSLAQLDEIHNEIFELKYRQGKSWQIISIDMSISRPQYFKKRRELVRQVAYNMGFINV
jgi:RinA family phage transcriptional activator